MIEPANPKTPPKRYRVLRELGRRVDSTFAALRTGSQGDELFVIQRFDRRLGVDRDRVTRSAADAIALEARCLSRRWHASLSKVRFVDETDDELTVATELIDGVTLEDLVRASPDGQLAPALLLRIAIDVLAGLSHIHGLRDESNGNAPLAAVHGAVCPRNVVVGRDGVARLVACFRPRPIKLDERSEWLGYAAPEAIDEGTTDARSDVYSVGVLLWEGLQGKRLFIGAGSPLNHECAPISPTEMLHRQREADIQWDAEAASLTARLGGAVLRALSFDPSLRFRSASELTSALRRFAATEIASGSKVASRVTELAGEHIRARRLELDPRVTGKGHETAKGARPIGESLPTMELSPTSREEPAPPTVQRPTPSEAFALSLREEPAPPTVQNPALLKRLSASMSREDGPTVERPAPAKAAVTSGSTTAPKNPPSSRRVPVTTPMVVRTPPGAMKPVAAVTKESPIVPPTANAADPRPASTDEREEAVIIAETQGRGQTQPMPTIVARPESPAITKLMPAAPARPESPAITKPMPAVPARPTAPPVVELSDEELVSVRSERMLEAIAPQLLATTLAPTDPIASEAEAALASTVSPLAPPPVVSDAGPLRLDVPEELGRTTDPLVQDTASSTRLTPDEADEREDRVAPIWARGVPLNLAIKIVSFATLVGLLIILLLARARRPEAPSSPPTKEGSETVSPISAATLATSKPTTEPQPEQVAPPTAITTSGTPGAEIEGGVAADPTIAVPVPTAPPKKKQYDPLGI